MISDKRKLVTVLLSSTVILIIVIWKFIGNNADDIRIQKIRPIKGSIKIFISSTGTVQPQNRLEIKPPINGRVEKVLVKEGQRVKTGQVLVLMSSLERAALIDAARSQGQKSLKYWKRAYKPIPLVAPISGMVIVRSVEPGQTVNSTLPILVLSDSLIVKAEIDETDIGRVKVGQPSVISLDAYPDVKVNGKVSHISYESRLINNVTMYTVEILPDRVPKVFRSGMSANVDIIEVMKDNILLLPVEAVKREGGKSFVIVSRGDTGKRLKRNIEAGISDDRHIEIISGLNEKDRVILEIKRYIPPSKSRSGFNPFRPSRKKKK